MTETTIPLPTPVAQTPDDAPELGVRAVGVLLLFFEREYGRERLVEMWRRRGFSLSLEYVTTMTNFVSLNFIERIIDALITESGDPAFMRKAGMLTASPQALGFLFHILRTFGNPAQTYRKMVELQPTFNRAGAFIIEKLGFNSMELSYKSHIPESNRNLCEGRMAQFASIPTIWKRPPAEVVEYQCQINGADCCRYHVRWTNPVRSWWSVIGLVSGAVGGLGVGMVDVAPATVMVPTLALGGASFGAWLDARGELRRKDELLAGQNEGLMQLAQRAAAALQRHVPHQPGPRGPGGGSARASSPRPTPSWRRARASSRSWTGVKSEFFDNVSHELRTPLTLILLTLESLLQRDAGSAARVRAPAPGDHGPQRLAPAAAHQQPAGPGPASSPARRGCATSRWSCTASSPRCCCPSTWWRSGSAWRSRWRARPVTPVQVDAGEDGERLPEPASPTRSSSPGRAG